MASSPPHPRYNQNYNDYRATLHFKECNTGSVTYGLSLGTSVGFNVGDNVGGLHLCNESVASTRCELVVGHSCHVKIYGWQGTKAQGYDGTSKNSANNIYLTTLLTI